MNNQRFHIFLSYARDDSTEAKMLAEHLEILERENLLTFWYDERIEPGEDWENEIATELERTDLAILLITKNFLNSDFIADVERPKILGALEQKRIKVYPLIARYCVWDNIPWLARLNVRPKNGVPVWSKDAEDPDIDAALTSAVKDIVKTLGMDNPVTKPTVALRPKSGELLVDRLLEATHELSRTVSEPILVDLRGPLVRARQSIERVLYFKLLHDLLQQIQNRCYEPINDHIKWFPKDETVNTTFDGLHPSLAELTDKLAAVAKMIPLGVSKPSWISTVEEASGEMGQAIRAREVGRLKIALRKLERVLNLVPGRLDANLQSAARELEIDAVVDLLQQVSRDLRDDGAEISAADTIEEAVKDLSSLKENLVKLIESHRCWQDVESDIRLIRVTLRLGSVDPDSEEILSNMKLNWPHLRDATHLLAADNREIWLNQFNKVSDGLDSALADGLIASVLNNFVNFCSIVSNKFDAVDTELKELCINLSEINKRLDELLGEKQ